jgi:hypothetical protein
MLHEALPLISLPPDFGITLMFAPPPPPTSAPIAAVSTEISSADPKSM